MYKRAYDPLRSTLFNIHNKLAPATNMAGMIGSYASQVQRFAPLAQVGAMIIGEEREHAARQKAKKQQLAAQQAAAQQQGMPIQQGMPAQQQGMPIQQGMQQQPLVNKQAAINDRLLLLNACNYILTVKQAKAYGLPAAMLLREKRAAIKKQAFIGGLFMGHTGAVNGNKLGKGLASSMGFSEDSWGSKILGGIGGIAGGIGGFLGGTALDGFTGGIGGGLLGLATNAAISTGVDYAADAVGNAADNASTNNSAQQTIANMKSQANNGGGDSYGYQGDSYGQTAYGQTSYGTA